MNYLTFCLITMAAPKELPARPNRSRAQALSGPRRLPGDRQKYKDNFLGFSEIELHLVERESI